MTWLTSAPSNIALIKYMGKKDIASTSDATTSQRNVGTNTSLSYTLDHLQTFVELTCSTKKEDTWEPLSSHGNLQLTEKEQKRFLSHLHTIKNYFNFNDHFILRSANNFPASCGLASSASSFAALTKCSVEAICALQNKPLPSLQEITALSRQGSGSSCRSFFKPFALWISTHAEEITLPYSHFLHLTILITGEAKKISSSQAHQRVLTSLLFDGRPQRAQKRLEQLMQALNNQQWDVSYQLVWQEFWDMHSLFETATPPFGYLLPQSLAALHTLQTYWEKHHDGPLVTMDAGPNIHLLFRPDQQEDYARLTHQLKKHFHLFTPHHEE